MKFTKAILSALRQKRFLIGLKRRIDKLAGVIVDYQLRSKFMRMHQTLERVKEQKLPLPIDIANQLWDISKYCDRMSRRSRLLPRTTGEISEIKQKASTYLKQDCQAQLSQLRSKVESGESLSREELDEFKAVAQKVYLLPFSQTEELRQEMGLIEAANGLIKEAEYISELEAEYERLEQLLISGDLPERERANLTEQLRKISGRLKFLQQ